MSQNISDQTIVLSARTVEARFKKLNLPFSFSEDELASLDTINVVDWPGRWLAFPTPLLRDGLNLLNLRRLLGVSPAVQPSFFDHPWYLEETFGSVDCAPGWHTLKMDVDRDSLEKTYDYDCRSAPSGLCFPTAVEVVLMLFLHYAETREQLLLKKHTWCSDEASLDRRVTIGAFGRNGVFVSGHPNSYRSLGLGVCWKVAL